MEQGKMNISYKRGNIIMNFTSWGRFQNVTAGRIHGIGAALTPFLKSGSGVTKVTEGSTQVSRKLNNFLLGIIFLFLFLFFFLHSNAFLLILFSVWFKNGLPFVWSIFSKLT